MRLDDPTLVAAEYADETRLRRRAAAHTPRTTGVDPRALAVAAVASVRPRRVLEVGCGWGDLAEWIARETGAEVVALDLSPWMVELARERDVDARVGDVQEQPFPGGEFECAVAAWMLDHVPHLERALAELARVLRPGGRLVAVTNSSFHLEELRRLGGSGPSPRRSRSRTARSCSAATSRASRARTSTGGSSSRRAATWRSACARRSSIFVAEEPRACP